MVKTSQAQTHTSRENPLWNQKMGKNTSDDNAQHNKSLVEKASQPIIHLKKRKPFQFHIPISHSFGIYIHKPQTNCIHYGVQEALHQIQTRQRFCSFSFWLCRILELFECHILVDITNALEANAIACVGWNFHPEKLLKVNFGCIHNSDSVSTPNSVSRKLRCVTTAVHLLLFFAGERLSGSPVQ